MKIDELSEADFAALLPWLMLGPPPPCKNRAGADIAGKPVDTLAPRGVDHTRALAGNLSPLSPTTVIGRGR